MFWLGNWGLGRNIGSNRENIRVCRKNILGVKRKKKNVCGGILDFTKKILRIYRDFEGKYIWGG